MKELRAYQQNAIDSIRKKISEGKRAPLCVSPTGSGKTVILSEIIKLHLQKSSSNKVLLVAHRRELIGQAATTLLKFGITNIGEIIPGAPYRAGAKVQVASTQTLRAREMFPSATLVIFDEAHHYSSDDYSILAAGYPNSIRLGFTATPIRSDGRGMSPAFDSIVVVSTIKELTYEGFLVPCKVIAPEIPLKRPALACKPVEAFEQHAKDRKTVVFAEFVKDAELFRQQFIERGHKAVVITGEMNQDERRHAFKEHERGATLINCMVLTEGWDSPETSCAILARGCGSVGTYLQIVGRILRSHPNKRDAVLIDLPGRAFHTHGAPDEDREYSLTGKGIRRKTGDEVKFCSACGNPLDEYPCEFCGNNPAGDRYLDPKYTGDRLAERYAAKRSESVPARIESLARWMTESRAKGWKPWSALSKFQAVYGYKPDAEMIKEATNKSYVMKTKNCIKCKKPVVTSYRGGQCGKCAYS